MVTKVIILRLNILTRSDGYKAEYGDPEWLS